MKRIVLFLLLCINVINVFAIYEKGGVLTPGAYPSSLGGAFCAKADDICAICYNPAGLYQINGMEIAGIYGGIANIKKDFYGLGLAHSFNKFITVAVSGFLLNTGSDTREDVYSLTLSSLLLNDEEKELSAGVNAKFLYAHYYDYASAMSADLGFLYKIKNISYFDSLNFGISIFDLQSSIRWKDGREEKIPLLLKSGLAFISRALFNFMFDIDIINDKNFVNNYKTLMKFGLEKNIGFVSFRIGYAGFETVLSSISLGMGIATENFKIDYSFLNHTEELGTTHKVDLKYYIPHMLYEQPLKIEVFPGNNRAYIKWQSVYGNPDSYKIYIESEEGEKFIKEKSGKTKEANFLIENLKNGIKYYIQIFAIYNGMEKERSEKLEIVPYDMDEKAKIFYKNAKMLYSDNKLNEALIELKNAIALNPKDADINMLKEKIENLINLKGNKE